MAQQGEETFSCSICLGLLKEPVTIPCGHIYCMVCISSFWDGEAVHNCYSCPQCKEVLTQRPVLEKNNEMEEVVAKKQRRLDAPAVESYATAEDVACDSCTESKLKAFKSCLVCLASFCEKHLQPHHESATFQRHKLVEPSKKLWENICPIHNEVMKIFCRTDQLCICVLCSMDKHKDHNMVSTAAENTTKQRKLQKRRTDIQKNYQDREKDVEWLKQQVDPINVSAAQTVEHNNQVFTELIRLLHNRMSELENEVQTKRQTEVSAVRALQQKMEQEISELKKRDTELQQLSHIENPIQFVLNYNSLPALNASTHSYVIPRPPENCFEEVTAAVSELSEDIRTVLMDDWVKVRYTMERVEVLHPREPFGRAGLLKYFQAFTVDPNTAHVELTLSEGNRQVAVMRNNPWLPPHPDRFTNFSQVLSKERVTGRCYTEVEWRGTGVYVAVAYKSIRRVGFGNDCGFGLNNKSWSLLCASNRYTFHHNNEISEIPGPSSYKIGVYVDHKAGILRFYSVRDTVTQLCTVKTAFTEPLHLGVWLRYYVGNVVKLSQH